jgi:DNA-binding GntR family transcriptional regulator
VPTAQEIRGQFELRQALECQSARLCGERATFRERLELQRLAANVDALYGKVPFQDPGDDWVFAMNQYHVDLHMKITEYARSGLLKAEIENTHILVLNWLYDTTRGRRILPPNFHADLISVIAEGNPPKAEEAMRKHVSYGLKSIQTAVEPLQQRNWRLKYQPRRRSQLPQ